MISNRPTTCIVLMTQGFKRLVWKEQHLRAHWLGELRVILIELHHSWQWHRLLIGVLVLGWHGPWQAISQLCSGNPLQKSLRDGLWRSFLYNYAGLRSRFCCISHLAPTNHLSCCVCRTCEKITAMQGLRLNIIRSLCLWFVVVLYASGLLSRKIWYKRETARKVHKVMFLWTKSSLAAAIGSWTHSVAVTSSCPEQLNKNKYKLAPLQTGQSRQAVPNGRLKSLNPSVRCKTNEFICGLNQLNLTFIIQFDL